MWLSLLLLKSSGGFFQDSLFRVRRRGCGLIDAISRVIVEIVYRLVDKVLESL